MLGYKLFRKRKDGTYGSLFFNRREKLVPGVVYEAKDLKKQGFAYRPGWHICARPHAPHLSMRGRVWCLVEFNHKDSVVRPQGVWHLGSTLKILEEIEHGTHHAE